MRLPLPAAAILIVVVLMLCAHRPAAAQQFNSDNYLAKPHGVATLILTFGERHSMLMNTFSLFPRWELTAAVYIFDKDNDFRTDDGYSTSFYAKYMVYENAAKTGGFAVKGGTGLDPGYLNANTGLKDAFATFWTNAPVTLPFFDNKVSVDLMPGANLTLDYGESNKTVGAFTYSGRVAYNPTSPKWAIVGEVFGAEGGAPVPAEYKIGPRWEPSQHAVFALTYGQEFESHNGALVEFGIMLFTPPFAKL